MNYQYTIEGEKLTLAEIVARIPNVCSYAVRRRVAHYGLRTWSDLRRPAKPKVDRRRAA